MPGMLLVCAVIMLGQSSAPAQKPPGQPLKKPGAADRSSALKSGRLTGIRLGTFPDYSRLIFLFKKPVDSYMVRRPEVNELWLDFGPDAIPKEGRYELHDELVQGVALLEQNGRLTARVKVGLSRFSFRHFSTPDRKAVVLDLRPGDPIKRARPAVSRAALEKLKGLSLELPDPKAIARKIRAALPADPTPDTELFFLTQAADDMARGNFEEAIINLKRLLKNFPNTKYRDPGLFLLGDAYYYSYQNKLEPHFLEITDTFREAIVTFPQSALTPRATLMLGLAYLKMNFNSEAVGYLEIVTKDFPDTRYAVLAYLYLGEAQLNLGEADLAQESLDTVLTFKPSGHSFLKAYYKLGQVHFQKGIYTKANEVFKEVLIRQEDFYLEHPEILYYMGEGYFHSHRPDLARSYLYHLLNIYPEYKAKDVVMARIGDTYKEEGRHSEAKKIYRITKDIFPESTGALISQLRLAEYGALRDSFKPETIFIELEEGAREATLKMYREIVASQKESPLLQLAMFKIGLAAYWQKNYKKALQTFKDTLEKYPKGSIIPDVHFVMSKTILARVRNLYRQKKHLELLSYFFENQRYISEIALSDIRLYVALSHLALDLPSEAIELFLADRGVPDSADQRLLGLGEAYLKDSQYEEAIKALNQFLKRYPRHEKKDQALLHLAQGKMKQGHTKEALSLFENAMTAQPRLKRDGEFQNMLGRIYLELGQYEKAAAALEIAAKGLGEGQGNAQDVFLAYAHLGRALAKVKRKGEAAQALDKALTVQPEQPFPEALYLIARTNFNLGRQKEGLEALDLVSKAEDSFWKMMADQELKVRKWNQELNREIEKEISANLQK